MELPKKDGEEMTALDHTRDEKGFTLVEMLISVCIMAIAFAGLATMQIACINGNAIAGNLTSGITLAQDKLEELNSLDYDDQALVNLNTTNDDPDPTNEDGLTSVTNYDYRETGIDGQGDAGGVYNRIYNIADDEPITGRKTVVVIVTWKNHRVTVSSIIGAPYS